MEAKVYNQKGEQKGTVTVPADVFNVPWNGDLVHQVITSINSNARAGTAHTKNRGDVSGGGKKPWQQKGTGRARHGSTRSPIWVGGGVSHGPRAEKNYARKVNKKMKDKALKAILSKKFKDGEVLFVDTLSFKEPKTKLALEVVTALAGIKGYDRLARKVTNAAFIALPKKDRIVEKSFNNFGNIEVGEARNIAPSHVLNYKFLVIADPEESFKVLL